MENKEKISTLEERYQISGEIGRGGMGVVYKATDSLLNRTVAIKTLLRGDTDPISIKRFQREAQTCAKLKHKNLVEIYDTGFLHGKYFFSMEYVAGVSLKEYSRSQNLSTTDVASIMLKICLAMEYAHEKNVIHRDLKPSNIMIIKNHEPKIMDFGLAYSTTNSTKLSQSGVVMGTLSYMPPEQLEAKRREIDARSDIYSLGAILYEVITGEPPFAGEYFTILHDVLKGIFTLPSQINDDVSKDLEFVCLKAMAKNKKERYQTAKQMALDLEKIMQGKELTHNYLALYKKKYLQRTLCVMLIFLAFLFGVISIEARKIKTIPVTKQETLNPPNIPVEIWQSCWDQEKEWFDFTKEVWLKLDMSLQFQYAKAYQKWYSQYSNEKINTIFSIANTKLEMILIPPGCFWMGNKNGRYQKVGLHRPFYISKYEITEKQFHSNSLSPHNNSDSKMTSVSWQEAAHFCEIVKASLPTESQWEYACRAGLTNDQIGENSWGCEGFGNQISEWCFDYAKKINAKENSYILTTLTKRDTHIEPISLANGNNYNEHICRDVGSYFYRETNKEEYKALNLGFRIVLLAKHIPKKFPGDIYKKRSIAKLSTKNVEKNTLENQNFNYLAPNAGLMYASAYYRLGFNPYGEPFAVSFSLIKIPEKLVIFGHWGTTGGGEVDSILDIYINRKIFLSSLSEKPGANSHYYWEINSSFLQSGSNSIEIYSKNGKHVWFHHLEVITYENP